MKHWVVNLGLVRSLGFQLHVLQMSMGKKVQKKPFLPYVLSQGFKSHHAKIHLHCEGGA
jgi:hypothetical protein